MKSLISNLPLAQRLRARVSLGLLRRIHRLTHRIPVETRQIDKARLLVVAPHMDDEIFGAGGVLLQHQDKGSDVSVVFCAAGATAEEDRTRKAESQAVAQAMGFSGIDWLDLPDGSLSLHESALGDRLAKSLAARPVDQIFCPFVTDHHRDHTAVAMGVAHAIEQTGWRGDVWCYEIWSPLWPNVTVDISAVEARKRKIIELYASQIETLHYAEGILGLNRYRGLRVYANYAEAFYVTDSRGFCALAHQMNSF